MNAAVPLGKAPGEWAGDAQLFRLVPPLDGIDTVVSSAIDLPSIGSDYRTSETMVFHWDSLSDRVADWGDLAMVPKKDHAAALTELGYTISAAPLVIDETPRKAIES